MKVAGIKQLVSNNGRRFTRPVLNERQIAALCIGEQALEDLSCPDRDDLIVKGLAVRAWPIVTGGDWKTWLTPEGAKLRLELFDPYAGDRHARLAGDKGQVGWLGGEWDR